ncbi:MAG: UDP-N-acetylglucosamine 1-carboxyvinyltransferase [Candidatus Omnitrophica bacterium ADurb.Bin292]|nr:MAG: UDP-N-acetylglucosamine 1-carboxyvinyltransferase [Candidatus Omnitrophica bacterium ADurb.Bin292]HPW76689.1 UDP-N-acetylglucosamine 1-carboxyvinyltransferase [Candidatus Omnitrophota bacterium]HQB11842.1 UDP-N-acetylglucosamine 1-carboxyvinyltransferase [Candidatus Omnitrophota bacterium]
MDKLIIRGRARLKGEVDISGSKNAVLPIMAAALLSEEESVIENVPNLWDVQTMVKLLRSLGAKAILESGVLKIKPGNHLKPFAPYKLVKTMRASVCVLGPLLARLGEAEVSLPGGCAIGPRPIDLHLKGLEALSAEIQIDHGYVHAKVTSRLRGTDIYLGGGYGSSVLATGNVMMAAVLAQGRTVVENAACEPEVVDLANFLKKMGAKIQGEGSPRIEIEGVKKLRGVSYRVIPDRIEAGTYMFASAITQGDVLIRKMEPGHLNAVIDKLQQAGVRIEKYKNAVRVKRIGKLRASDVTTLAYPAFPTDLQAQAMALMTITPGISIITEKIYPNRFMHVPELGRMGAKIFLEGPSAIVHGVRKLSGAPVMASDLRASAALVLAALVAEGETEVQRIYHLDRGYEDLEKKLTALGATIRREKE